MRPADGQFQIKARTSLSSGVAASTPIMKSPSMLAKTLQYTRTAPSHLAMTTSSMMKSSGMTDLVEMTKPSQMIKHPKMSTTSVISTQRPTPSIPSPDFSSVFGEFKSAV